MRVQTWYEETLCIQPWESGGSLGGAWGESARPLFSMERGHGGIVFKEDLSDTALQHGCTTLDHNSTMDIHRMLSISRSQ